MKNIIVTVLLTLLIAATISALSIVSYRTVTGHSEPTPQPDRVVAVLAKCQFGMQGTLDLTGSQCQQDKSTFNRRLQLFVRTSEGSTYQIEVPIDTKVAVGDTWPK